MAPFACGPGWVTGPQAGWMVSMAAALTLQKVLGSPAFAPTDMAELAAAAAPGIMMLGQGPLSLLQAEWVERVTANLAEHQLM